MGIFEKALMQGEEILSLIPQRHPIVMVDAFYGADEVLSYSGLTITPGNIFCENNTLREPGLIEHVAQSAAARVGYLCMKQNIPVPVGFIGAIKNFQIYRLPVTGETLHTTIKIEQDFMDITLISAKVMIAEEMISECEMKIFLQK